MRKEFILGLNTALLLLSFGFASTPLSTSVEKGTAASADWEKYGQGVTLDTLTPIEAILKNPQSFEGKIVAVEGKIVGVCAMMGCWVELQSPDNARLRIKVEDGAIVFPQEAQGQRAVAQGKVEILKFSREEYENKLRHEAEEMGYEFDPASIGDPPYQEVRLWGSGARIEKTP